MDQERIALARQMYEIFNSRNFDRLGQVVTDDLDWLNVAFGISFHGPSGARQFMEGWAGAFSDGRVDVTNLVAAGNYAISEFFFRGTHTRALETPGGPVAPTGRHVEMPVCDVMHFRGDRVDNIRAYFDAATLMRQLGVMAGAMAASQAASYQPSP